MRPTISVNMRNCSQDITSLLKPQSTFLHLVTRAIRKIHKQRLKNMQNTSIEFSNLHENVSRYRDCASTLSARFVPPQTSQSMKVHDVTERSELFLKLTRTVFATCNSSKRSRWSYSCKILQLIHLVLPSRKSHSEVPQMYRRIPRWLLASSVRENVRSSC